MRWSSPGMSSRPTAISTALRIEDRRWIESGNGVRTEAEITVGWGWRAQAKENQTAPAEQLEQRNTDSP